MKYAKIMHRKMPTRLLRAYQRGFLMFDDTTQIVGSPSESTYFTGSAWLREALFAHKPRDKQMNTFRLLKENNILCVDPEQVNQRMPSLSVSAKTIFTATLLLLLLKKSSSIYWIYFRSEKIVMSSCLPHFHDKGVLQWGSPGRSLSVDIRRLQLSNRDHCGDNCWPAEWRSLGRFHRSNFGSVSASKATTTRGDGAETTAKVTTALWLCHVEHSVW